MSYTYNYRPDSYQYDYGHPEEIAATPEPVGWREVENERGESSGVGGHGLSGYRWRKCRCPICEAAKAKDARRYKQKIKAKRLTE
jgi:hypothetical protein